MEAKRKLNEDIINIALETLTGKWKLKIIWEISYGNGIRFNELERKLNGISSIMLTKRLRELVDSGIVHREQYNEIPPRVEYSLTDLGIKLCPVLHMLEEVGYNIKNNITTSK